MPILYARRSWRLVAQITADVFVLVWSVVWGLVAYLVHSVVAAMATPLRGVADAVHRVSGDFRTAADKAAAVPGLGAQLRRPFDDAVLRLDGVITSVDHQVVLIERAALVLGWLTFALPVLIMVIAWLPRRIRFARQAQATQRFVDARPDLDLFALRALTGQPIQVLARINHDPAAAWRSGDRSVIDALAELELRRSGVRLPPRAQPGGPAGSAG